MTLTERELLERFLEQMSAARAVQKDPEAERLIAQAVVRQPDAAYLLVQRALQLEQVLEATQAQLQKLQAEAEQSQAGSRRGFLSDTAWGSQPSTPVAQSAGLTRQSAPVAGSAASMSAQPTRPGWGGGMLGNIATTAAGVVAGSFLFQGIERMMHQGDTSWGGGRDHSAQSGLLDNDTTNVYDHDTPPVDTAMDSDFDSFADSGDGGDFS
jgi:uncharacterized protein